MKSIIPDPAQLDDLAAGLDAGWDDEPTEAAPSHPPLAPSKPPHSTPLPPSLDALDADWGDGDDDSNDAEPTPAHLARGGATAGFSKRDRREVERQRRAHQAKQNSASKQQRKAERLAEARQASERQRKAELQAIAERQKLKPKSQAKPARKRPQPSAEPSEATAPAKRVAKRTRREPPAVPRPVALTAAPTERVRKSEPQSIVVESKLQRLLVPIVIALVVAVTLGFALSRAR